LMRALLETRFFHLAPFPMAPLPADWRFRIAPRRPGSFRNRKPLVLF
jgi:hypothetical protein